MRAFHSAITALIAILTIMTCAADAAEWRKGDKGDLRITLNHPDMPGSYRFQVNIYDRGGGTVSAQSDSISWGDLVDVSRPFIYSSYQTGHFSYDRMENIISGMFPKDAFDVDWDRSETTHPSPFGDVDAVSLTIHRKDNPTKRACVLWSGYLNGNRLIYNGFYCPAGHAPTIDETRAAIAAIRLKDK